MVWDTWLANVGTAIGTTTAEAGYIVSFAFILMFTLITVMASKGNNMAIIIVSMGSVLVFTIFGWVSYWILLLFTLIVAGMYASSFRKWFGA